jgi:long-chain acyl-CoA synthetase
MEARVAEQGLIARNLARIALAMAARWAEAKGKGARPGPLLRFQYAVADALVLRRLRAVMGGHIKWMITGSAAAPIWILQFFESIGLLVLEAYGISENPLPVAANRPNAYRFGSVGRPLSPNVVRLAEDGEVLVKGATRFKRYVEDDASVDRSPSGFYPTGDYGRLDEDGFLYLTGRKGEMIKTSNGRQVAPALVESVYRRSRYFDQIVVLGHNRPHLAALIALNQEAVRTALNEAGSDSNSAGFASATSPAVRNLVSGELARLGAAVPRHEQVRAFAILPSPLTVEQGELTTTLKPRRAAIEARHAALIETLYASAPLSPDAPVLRPVAV